MTDEQSLAALRAAERMGLIALRWMPYTDECIESLQDELRRDNNQLNRDLTLIRRLLKDTVDGLLNVAEHKGAK